MKTTSFKEEDEMVVDKEEQEDYEEDDDAKDENVHVHIEESNLTVLGKEIAYHGESYKKYVIKMIHGNVASRRYHVLGARLENNGLVVGNKELWG